MEPIDLVTASEEITARELCGDGYPWPSIRELIEGERVAACYMVRSSQVRRTRQDKPFLRLSLGDATGQIDAMVWDDALRYESLCAADAVIGVRGRVGTYRDRLQLSVDSIHAVRLSDEEHARLLPAAPRPLADMERELDELLGSVQDAGLRALVSRLIGRRGQFRKVFRIHPAARFNHHAYLGGLLEHSVSLGKLCHGLAAHYVEQGLPVDRDLLLAGALLHDIGKLRELSGTGSFGYTNQGHLLGHILIGLEVIRDAASEVQDLSEERLTLLLHLIASHQGRLEWASPVVPRTVEAVILHAADHLDATANKVRRLLDEVEPGDWTAYDRSEERAFFRPAEGTPSEPPARGDDAGNDAFDLFGDTP